MRMKSNSAVSRSNLKACASRACLTIAIAVAFPGVALAEDAGSDQAVDKADADIVVTGTLLRNVVPAGA